MPIQNPLPTPAHRELVDNFKTFLGSSDRFFYIDAPGGCGKTTVVRHLINSVIPEWNAGASLLSLDPIPEVYVTATHHKAASVLSQQGLPATTIHSHLGLTLQFNKGSFQLMKTGKLKGLNGQVVFLDECSYTCNTVYWHMKKLAREANIKFVLVGDRFQAPPVGLKESVVYQGNPKLNPLTEILRTDIPKLKDVYLELRQQLEYNESAWVPLIQDTVTPLDRSCILDIATNNPSIILGYKNTTIVEHNELYRKQVGLPKDITEGDYCMLNSAVESTTDKMVPTDASLQILHVGKPTAYKFDGGVELMVRLVDVVVNGLLESTLRVADSLEIKKALAYLKKHKEWSDFYWIKKSLADVRFTHALTIHKSQGSTYEHVIIDLDDLSKCTDSQLARKLLYVAITRAKSRVYLVGELAPRIGTISDDYF